MENLAENTVREVQNQLTSIKTELSDNVSKIQDEFSQKYTELSDKFENLYRNSQRMDTSSCVDPTSEALKTFSRFLRADVGSQVKLETREMIRRDDPITGNTDNSAQGGYAVPFVLDREILKKEKDLNVMRQLCKNISVSSPDTAWNIDLGGATSGWVAETDTRGQTDAPTLGRATITWGELYAMPCATQYLLDDAAFGVEEWYMNSVSEKFADEEENAFLTGNGTKKPKGLLAYTYTTDADDARALGSLQKVSGALTFDSILKLYYSLRQVYRRQGECAWLMNGATIEALRKVKDEQERYIWVDNIANGMAGSLLGCPVYESRFMPGATTSGNLAVLFGNFNKAYTIVDRLGLNVIRDPYTVKGQVAFYTSKRVGNVLMDDNAVKALAISA